MLSLASKLAVKAFIRTIIPMGYVLNERKTEKKFLVDEGQNS